MKPNWDIDHIGIAVRSLKAASRFYLEIAGYKLDAAELSEEHQVEIQFLEGPGPLLELIAPLSGNTTLERFLQSRGEGLHHLCYRVPSVREELERLKKAGIPLVDQVPRLGSRGLEVAFLHPKASGSGVLIEICSAF